MSEPNLDTLIAPARPEVVSEEIRRPRPAWIETLTSADHKRVGKLYIGTALSFAVLALVELLLMRFQLTVDQNTLLEPVTFNRLLSVYGATTIFLFALPLAVGIATYIVPLQIGARTTALPRLGLLGWWLFAIGGFALYATFLFTPPESGVNPLAPLSDDAFASTRGIDAWVLATGLTLLGLIASSVNLLATLHNMRAPGMAWRRMPLFSWSATVSGYLIVVLGGVMLAALTMLLLDRHYDAVYFEPGEGGAPLFWQHLSWGFFTGAYFVVLLTAFGAIAEILPVLAGRRPPSHRAQAGALVAIGVLGPLAWMQNMLAGPISVGFLYFAMLFGTLICIPIAILLYNWIATIWGGALRMRAPLLFALGAISTIVVGLGLELIQTVVPVAWQLANTAFATAATHYALVGGAVFGGFAALYYWFPKMTGRTMLEGPARLSFWLLLIGVHLSFAPLLLAGLEGEPVDIYKYFPGLDVDTYNLIATLGTLVLAAGVVTTLVNAIYSLRNGPAAGHDPWRGRTLEWFALSPPAESNFDLAPDVRSAEPLVDIRRAIERRTGVADPEAAEETQPVA